MFEKQNKLGGGSYLDNDGFHLELPLTVPVQHKIAALQSFLGSPLQRFKFNVKVFLLHASCMVKRNLDSP